MALGLIVFNVVLRFVPIPRLLLGLAISFYYGFKGSRIAVYDKRYKTLEELRTGERGWTIAGAIVLFFSPAPPR